MGAGNLEELRWTCERALNWHGNRRAAELLAEIPSDSGVDRYGSGGAVEALEHEIRDVLGKPAAVFMPSGTMAQQIAIRVHADRRGVRTFAFHPTAHLELHEDKAYQRLHDLVGLPLGEAGRMLTLDDLTAVKDRPVRAAPARDRRPLARVGRSRIACRSDLRLSPSSARPMRAQRPTRSPAATAGRAAR